ncbi:hypothetical protein [Bizionia myxarmorum]|uniref:Uncharacterized protein n=1 Tax=Bizionia myxarmorum TaxID=291186 RepID=A0A5D0RGE2_9FLAO|nr:hypothetical protein [Bizionia myxarmorum]TYB79584.1 hypothetical protein ES674_07460 [Bizionia myxarmorum]
MKQIILIGIFTVLGLTTMQAQTSTELQPVKTNDSTTQVVSDVKTVSIEIAAKKKDILTDKIESKLNGTINLFVVKERRVVC